MHDSSIDYYVILGVEPDATAKELRGAYRRIVKEHPPESGGETFRLASEAYRVLCNPERRRSYDAEERLPPAVDLRLRQIAGRLQKNVYGAEEELRALCREHFVLRAPRFTLGVLLDRTARHEEAADVFDLLFAECQDNATYARHLGDALVKAGDESNGIAYLKQAIVLDESDHEAYVCLARCHTQAGRFDEALDVLDRGIHADAAVDIGDVHLLLQRMIVHARMGAAGALQGTADLLVSAVPDDDDEARRWTAGRLQGLCRNLQIAGRTPVADLVFQTMRRLDPQAVRPRAAVQAAPATPSAPAPPPIAQAAPTDAPVPRSRRSRTSRGRGRGGSSRGRRGR